MTSTGGQPPARGSGPPASGAIPGDPGPGDRYGGDDQADWEARWVPPSEEELCGLVPDPDTGPPDGWEFLTEAQRRALLGDPGLDAEPVAEALDAGFTHRFGGNGTGFCAGGPLDVMPPGGELARHVCDARLRGLAACSDGELIGVGGAAQRLESWAAEVRLSVVAELDARRAGPDGREGEHGTAALAGRDLDPAAVIAADKTLDADARWLKAHDVPGSHDQRRALAYLARLTGQPLTGRIPAPAATAGGGPASGPQPWPPAGTPGAPYPGWPGGLGGAGSLGGPGGTVNLTMPAATWLGSGDAPGEITGTGPADAATCRQVAGALAAHPATRWCVTVTDARGRATGHGCARAGPGPPATASPAAWLATITITPVETGTCTHRRESAAYQPPDPLRHIIKIRSRRCGFPGCRRPATRCDDDHTIPHHSGGRTCECNLHPLCRRHHQTKQAPGWRLDQPEPGVLIWTTPAGRTITVTPEPYPA
jgi:hypothetical protein